MASFIVPKDGTSNSSGNNLKTPQQATESTGGSGGFYDVASAIDQAYSIINNKEIQSDIITNKFPGYLPEQFQNTIKTSGYENFYAQPAWHEQKWLEFVIIPPLSHRYNPSLFKLIIKFRMVNAADNGNLPNNTIPVENVFKKLFNRVEIINMNSNTFINNNIKYDDSILDFTANWFYDAEDYKHSLDKKTTELCERVGRRLQANVSNRRLNQRIQNEHAGWAAQTRYEITLSNIHQFFRVNSLMGVPLKFKFYLNDDNRQLFETVPGADVGVGHIFNETGKILYDTSYLPRLIAPIFEITETHQQQDRELFSQNGVYDLGNYVKVYNRMQTITAGAEQINIDINGINERPNFIVIRFVSLTNVEHLSVYDNTFEDVAMNKLKRIVINGINTDKGVKTLNYELNDDSKFENQLSLHGNFCRLVAGCPSYMVEPQLKNTAYLRNLPTQAEFLRGQTNLDRGCFPLVFDLTDSKGTINGTLDDTRHKSPNIQLNLYLNPGAADVSYNVLVDVLTSSNIILQNFEGSKPTVTMV